MCMIAVKHHTTYKTPRIGYVRRYLHSGEYYVSPIYPSRRQALGRWYTAKRNEIRIIRRGKDAGHYKSGFHIYENLDDALETRVPAQHVVRVQLKGRVSKGYHDWRGLTGLYAFPGWAAEKIKLIERVTSFEEVQTKPA